jgi:hypothetical protein
VSADIVILASAHNPSILSPDWLKEKGLIRGEPDNFIYTPDLSVCESGDFSLVVDRQRMQIASKKFDSAALNMIKTVAINYINLLPNIPYNGLGMNFVWIMKADASETLLNISIKINKLDNFTGIFKGHELSYGCIINAKKDPYLLTLIVKPQEDKSVVLNFNYHHNIKGVDEKRIVEYVENFVELSRYSQNIIDDIMKGV